jgi:hypothetical protein
MKTIISLGALMISLMAVSAAEEDIWYDANGKAVKVTRVVKEKAQYVPVWKKREHERLARMEAQRLDQSTRSRSSRTSNWDPYAAYYSGYSGYGSSYSHGWSCSPSYYSHHRPHSYGRSNSAFRFQGSYQKSGWSVRVSF